MILSSLETAKYNREQEMYEIHLNFVNHSYKVHFFRNSVKIPTSFKTTKYNREQKMKEIHLKFM